MFAVSCARHQAAAGVRRRRGAADAARQTRRGRRGRRGAASRHACRARNRQKKDIQKRPFVSVERDFVSDVVVMPELAPKREEESLNTLLTCNVM